MAVIRDVIPAFELFQPATIDDAVRLLDQHGADAWVLAGGLDSMDWLKDRIKRPKVVVDLSQVNELKGVRDVNGGIEIGAMTPLTEVVRHPVVKEKFGLLMRAAELVASPQIRNQGTIGGNVSQDTRCWYYRSGWSCYRAGGNICYADTPDAINREHAILGADHYFVGPGTDITRMNALRPGELLTAIRLPGDWAGSQFYFEKVRDRQVWDFALVSVASAMVLSGTTIQNIRLVVNGVAARPLRLAAVEALVKGKPRNEATAALAGELAIEGAQPLRFNAYKVPLMRNLVKRAIRGVEEWTTS